MFRQLALLFVAATAACGAQEGVARQEAALVKVDAGANVSMDMSAAVDLGPEGDLAVDDAARKILQRARTRFRYTQPPSGPLGVGKNLGSSSSVIDARTPPGAPGLHKTVDAFVSSVTNGAARMVASAPANALGPTTLLDTRTGAQAGVRLNDAYSVPGRPVEGFVVYPGGHLSGADVVLHPTEDGVEDFLLFEHAPSSPTVRYTLELGDDTAGLRLVDDVVELLDKDGTPRMHMSPPILTSIDETEHRAAVSIEGCAVDTDLLPPWGRPVTPPGSRRCTVVVAWDADAAYPAMLDPYWSSTGNLTTGRYAFAAVAMPGQGVKGQVLVTGGFDSNSNGVSSTEIYDTNTGTWTTSSPLGYPSTAALGELRGVLLSNGRVAVSGGTTSDSGSGSTKVTIYNPATGAWASPSTTTVMSVGRRGHSMTVVPTTNQVLIVGGTSSNSTGALTSWELWASDMNSRTSSGSLTVATAYHTATVTTFSSARRVVIVGGWNDTSGILAQSLYFTGSGFASTGAGAATRGYHDAVGLADGRLLVAGGLNNSTRLRDAQVMSTTGTWSSMPSAMQSSGTGGRSGVAVAALGDGGAIILGGTSVSSGSPPLGGLVSSSPLVDRFNASSTNFSTSGNMTSPRSQFAAVPLTTKQVLAISGKNSVGNSVTATSELYLFLDGTSCGSSYECVSSNCASSVCVGSPCSTDTQCQSSAGALAYCGGSVCVAKKADGAASTIFTQCKSGIVADSVCCKTACNSDCDTCSASGTGTCTALSSSTACGSGRVCNGTALSCPINCTSPNACASGYYCSGTSCNIRQSDGTSCTSGAQCSSNACTSSVCVGSSCTTDSQCGTLAYCTGTVCAARRSDGNSCTAADQCVNNSCISSVCVPSSCASDAACYGGNYCNASQVCAADVVAGAACSSNHECATGSCQGGSCVGGSCTTDAPCGTGAHCSGGVCVPKASAGTPASSAADCASGHYASAEGICCDTDCSDSCASCSLPGQVGHCASAPQGTRCAGNAVCGGAPSTTCPGTCSTDAQCQGGYRCISGSCVAKVPNGGTCSTPSDCGSGFCFGNTCCGSACNDYGSCSTCSATPGTCTLSTGAGCSAGVEPVISTPTANVATTPYEASKSLWSGSGSIQGSQIGSTATVTGIAASVFDPNRAGTIHGVVLAASGQPLSGIRVRVLAKINGEQNYAYGVTFTRLDGSYDFVVNGGVAVTLFFEENLPTTNFLPAQRDVVVPARGMVAAPTVTLVLKSTMSAPITLNGTWQHFAGPQVGSGISARTPNIIIPGTIAATVTPVSGSPATYGSVNFRLTEFTDTVDLTKMPGPLPPSSAFTYAADVAVDEARATDQVTFTGGNPILYVDDFIGFAAASIAPLGSYDYNSGTWKAAPNGRVVNLLSVSGGLMNVDITGDGSPDTDINEDGISDSSDTNERTQLAAMYPTVGGSGKKVWRTVLPHLTGWDINWGIAPPPGAAPCSGCDPVPPPDVAPPVCMDSGSIIECQNQTLGEEMALAGTPFRLSYRSNRQVGRGRELSFGVFPSSVPANVTGAVVTIEIAGRTIERTYPLVANTKDTYRWDGKNALGQFVFGDVPVALHVGYDYAPVYSATQEFGYNASSSITYSAARNKLTYFSTYNATLSSWDERGIGLGGWDIDVHHTYDPKSQTLYLGTGEKVLSELLARTVQLVAGNVPRGICSTVGGPLATTGLDTMTSMAIAPSGRIYFTSTCSGTGGYLAYIDPVSQTVVPITRASGTAAALTYPRSVTIAPDGQLYVLNGSNGTNFQIYKLSAAGTVATDIAPLANLTGDFQQIVAAPDGSVYTFDRAGTNNRLLRITTAGTVQVVAGYGAPTSAAIPFHTMKQVGVSRDGTVYLNDNGTVYRFTQGFDPVAVMGAVSCSGGCSGNDGTLGTAFTRSIGIMAVAPDGTIYTTEDNSTGGGPRIWRLDLDGIVRQHVGLPTTQTLTGKPSLPGAPAISDTANYLQAVTVAPDGSVYFYDDDHYPWYTSKFDPGTIQPARNQPRILHVAPPLPSPSYDTGSTGVVYSVASKDGAELYGFTALGQHSETRDARTGALRWTFGYDTNGRLTSILDRRATNIVQTTVSYGAGTAVITGPYGHTTTLTIDSTSGYTTAIHDPVGNATTLSYDGGGLLTKLVDGRGISHLFQYDSNGRLTRDANPSGVIKTLAVVAQRGKTTVTIDTSGLGTKTHVVETSNGGEKRTSTDVATGLSTVWERAQGSINTQTNADGSVVTWTESVDPRLLMQAPFTSARSETLSIDGTNNLVSSTSSTRMVQCSTTPCGTAVDCNPTNQLQSRLQTDTTTVNGSTFTSAYDSCGAGSVPTITRTSAVGRTVVTTLDASGRVKTVATPGIDPVTINYDADNRISSSTQGTGTTQRVVTLNYNFTGANEKGQLLTQRVHLSPSDLTTTYSAYDADARPLSILLEDGANNVAFTFDQNGNLSSLDPPGATATPHSFSYDPRDKLSVYAPPAVSGDMSTRYEYTTGGLVASELRPDGDTLNFSYDTARRLTQASHPVRTLNYTYDALGRLSTISSNDTQTLTYGYTTTGSLVRSQKWTGPVGGSGGFTTTYTYDSNHRVATETASGVTTTYTYDGDGLIANLIVTNTAGTLTSNNTLTFGHDPGGNKNGLVTGATVGTLSDSRTYNEFGELASYVHGTQVAYTLDAASHPRDQLGRITERAESWPTTRTLDYAYDARGRLTDVLNGSTTVEHYAYDANGNRTGWTNSSGTWTCSAVDAQDRLTSCTSGASTLSYTYKANGDVATRSVAGRPMQTLTYDAFGNLLSVVPVTGARIDYIIDGKGRRVGKKVGGTLTRQWLWSSQLRPIAELDGSGALLARYVYASHVNVPDLIIKGTTVYRVVTDHLGSVRAVVNAGTGTAVQTLDYDTFGNILSASPALGTAGQDGFQTFGFAGGFYDVETSFLRFGVRDYDQITGLWLAADPLRFGGGQFNLRQYSSSDPINIVDLAGLNGGSANSSSAGVGKGSAGADASSPPPGDTAPNDCHPMNSPPEYGHCMQACKQGGDAILAFCQSLPPGPIRATCWGLTLGSEVACLGWCSMHFFFD